MLKHLSIVQPPVPIRVRDKTLYIEEDNIVLYSHQMQDIRKQARRRSEREWLCSDSGVKVTLTSTQQQQILHVKDQIFNFLSPSKDPKEVLRKKGSIGFTVHASERILERVERLSVKEVEEINKEEVYSIIDPHTLEKIVESLIKTDSVYSKAEWKGYPYLNYTFLCQLGDRTLDVVVNFGVNILIITISVKKDSGYLVREIYSYDQKGIYKKE